MSFIVDTHALIFFGCGHKERIGEKAMEVFKNLSSMLYISQISYWELAIKINIGKLEIPILDASSPQAKPNMEARSTQPTPAPPNPLQSEMRTPALRAVIRKGRAFRQ